jgi:pyruvate-ferredoxin/flavodoxin oxidoreductase
MCIERVVIFMKVIDGCTACANMAYNLSELCFIYPITPSSLMASQIDNLSSTKEKNIFDDTVNVVEMQSEAGAAGALHGALSAGILASTFTSSQGLLLMIPNMYKMAGEMLPAVIHVASRSLATHALSIFGDHQDIYAIRSTGFCILASTNVQDSYNLALIAHLSAIKSSLPFLHFFDGFRTSHEYNMINEIDKSLIKEMVSYDDIKKFRERALNSNKAITMGTNQNEDIYFQSVEARATDYLRVDKIVADYMNILNEKIGTNYKPFNYYGSPNAKYVIIAMGSVCDTIKQVLFSLNNVEFGLIEVHLYRPFSKDYLLSVIPASVERVAVLDRTKEQGSMGEPLYLDVLAALNDIKIDVYGGRYGLSSKNTTPGDIYDVFMMLKNNPKNNYTIGINDDVNHTSLKHYNFKLNNNYREFKIYGFGSDGMVSASKNILKILGKNSYVQGYFEYDSKKSGGITISHLRLADELINAPYYVNNPELMVITKDEYFYKFKMLDEIKDNGILLINSKRNEEELNRFLPNEVKEIILKKNIKVMVINAEKLASSLNIAGKISLIIEAAILYLLKVENLEELLINDIKSRFLTKGEDIVNSNINSVKMFKSVMYEARINDKKGISLKEFSSFNEIISSRKGNELRVSDLSKYKDGTFLGGTSKYDKRKMSSLVPKWDKNKCIQCGICSLVCPHAVIRPFLVDLNDKYADLGKDSFDKKYKFIIGISEADCTGCSLCIKNCPQNCLSFGYFDDENQKISNDLFENYENPLEPCNTIRNVQLRRPLFEFSGACAGCGETPYIKLLTQVVGEKLVIANATGCSSIYGGSCSSSPYKISWGNSLFEDNAEYAFGILNTYDKLRKRVLNILKNEIKSQDLLDEVLLSFNDYNKMLELRDKVTDFVPDDLTDYILPKSVWAIGGDGWAYDIGFGGIDHVLSSNKNVKILVLDTEVYSNTGGQSSKSTRIGAVAEFANEGKRTYKKDLFKMAMNYPNIYVASVSLGANMMHTLRVFKEAEEHQGPAIVIAYAPCIEHGIKGGMSNSIEVEKNAVMCGYVLLMRYFNDKLYIDSNEPNFDKYNEFLLNETRYNALRIKNKKESEELLNDNKSNAINRYNYYKNKIQ